jgi:predicted secreted protein
MSMDMITVAVNDEFTISLKSIATAGYVWKVESLPEAIQLLGIESGKQAEDAKPGDPTGQVFRFRAHTSGEHKIKFALGRPWENKSNETRTVTVSVT